MEPSGEAVNNNRTSCAMTKEVNTIVVSSTSSSVPAAATAAAVPTTVITSSRTSSTILPFCFRPNVVPSPATQPLQPLTSNPNPTHPSHSQQTENNPNLVSLLSGSCDLPEPTTTTNTIPQHSNSAFSTSTSSPPHSNSLQSILLAKDSLSPNSPDLQSSRTSASPSPQSPLSSSNSSATPSSHSFLTEKCHNFFLSSSGAGTHPCASTFLSSCSTQNNALIPKASNHGSCIIYKGYKRLCNAQSLFKCKSSSDNHDSTSSSTTESATFNPNHPFGQPADCGIIASAAASTATSATATASSTSMSTCILSDLLRGGCPKSRNKKNLPFAESTAENIIANNSKNSNSSLANSNDRVSVPNGATNTQTTTMATILAASLDSDNANVKGSTTVPAVLTTATAENQAKECHFTYYSQMLKNRIKKLCNDSETPAVTPEVAANQMSIDFKPPGDQSVFLESGPSAATAATTANHCRQSVISKLGVYPQLGSLSQSRLPYMPSCIQPSRSFLLPNSSIESKQTASAPPPAPAQHLSHTSVNSYLDTLIRTNVIREQAELTQQNTQEEEGEGKTPVEGAISSASSNVVTTLSSTAVITTAADINPNKPHHFVNLIDKIISNVFTVTTAAGISVSNSSHCFLSPNDSSSTTCTTSSQSKLLPSCSLASVLSHSQSESTALAAQAPTNESSFFGSQSPTPSPAPPSRPPSRPASNVSAICQLLNSDGSPPASPAAQSAETGAAASFAPSPCQMPERPPSMPTPTIGLSSSSSSRAPSVSSQPMDCLNDISDKVYQQLIEFEFNHESILKKFQSTPTTDSFSHSTGRPGLNVNEKARIEELEKVLYPLQFCLSSMCDQQAEMKKNLHKSFFEKNSNVSVDFQRQTLLATTEQAINLLIELTKQLDSFAELSSADQMNLLRTSVMEIMLMRSILIMPQRLKEKMTNRLKRCLEENGGSVLGTPTSDSQLTNDPAAATTTTADASVPSAGSSTMKEHCRKMHQNLNHPGKLISYYMRKMHQSPFIDDDMLGGGAAGEKKGCQEEGETEPCTNHPHDRPFNVDLASTRVLDELMSTDDERQELIDESSRDSFSTDDTSFSNLGSVGSGENMAADYAKQFRAHYIKLARSIDKDWYEDRTIFYLLFAILLFRPTKTKIDSVDKVREEHLTYVYLLKRYLENKFKSYCTARSHFIRIFDRLEELQKMNDQVIQKLLDFDLVCAQNLLEKLCIC